MSLEEIFPELYGDSVKQMSLTLLYEGMGVEKGFTVSIKPILPRYTIFTSLLCVKLFFTFSHFID